MMMTVGSMTTSMTMIKRDRASLQIEDQETTKAKEDLSIAITMTIGTKGPGMGIETRIETQDPIMIEGGRIMETETRIETRGQTMTDGGQVTMTETGDPAMTSVTETRLRTAPGTGGPPQTGGGILTATTLTPAPLPRPSGTDMGVRNLQIVETNITIIRTSSRRDNL